MHLAVGDAQRIEIRRQMAHDAVSADQHQRAQAVLRRAKRGGRRQLKAGHLSPLGELVAHIALGGTIVPCERSNQLAVGLHILDRTRP